MNPTLPNQAYSIPGRRDNPFQNIGFGLLLAFILVMYSRFFDLFFVGLQIPLITSLFVLASSVFSGGVLSVTAHRTGKYLLVFTAWVSLAVVFSIWRSGSIPVLTGWIKAALVYLFIVSLTATYNHCMSLIKTLALAIMALGLTAIFTGTSDNGRLFLSAGKLENPNDLAQVFVIGLPLVFFMYKQSKRNYVLKVLAGLFVAITLYLVIKTGSRGALIGLTGMVIYYFITASMGGRIALALGGILALTLFMVYMPAGLRARLALSADDTHQESNPDLQHLEQSAATSAEARQRILRTSIDMTFQHPILGVGPGMFAEAVEQGAMSQGLRTQWLETHNSYTQVSSETGILGLILYLSIIVSSFRATKTVSKLTRNRRGEVWETITDAALCIRLSMIGFAITAFFSSVAYQSLLPTLAGLCAVLYMTAQRESTAEQLAHSALSSSVVAMPKPALHPSFPGITASLLNARPSRGSLATSESRLRPATGNAVIRDLHAGPS